MKKIAFTIVLNGFPFIQKQAEILPFVFDEWYIVEGATRPIKDTSWCKDIDKKYFNDKKLSIDGTTEFLDELTAKHSNVHVIRKNDFWDGKVEMCNSFMDKVENCILMQFDVDEIWKPEILRDIFDFCENTNHFDAMLFKCNYYVGPDLIITNENCYGNPWDHWPRLWKVQHKTTWRSHEPPRINGLDRYLHKDFTKQKGWIFDHYSYVYPFQVEFKENFYGYTGALQSWTNMQNSKNFPEMLKNHLPWVHDNAIVDRIPMKYKIYIVHYKKNLDRRAYLDAKLKDFNVTWWDCYQDVSEIPSDKKFSITPKEMLVALAHQKIYAEHNMEDGFPLILEDDVIFPENLRIGLFFDTVLQEFSHSDADVIFLGKIPGLSVEHPLPGKTVYTDVKQCSVCTHAYSIKPKKLAEINKELKYDLPIDHDWNRLISTLNLKVAWSFPALEQGTITNLYKSNLR